ncbi:MAG: LacI family transcriptional regulator [Lachnospiraceae bacterium]|nr:LacI family transcriptional regulator [Lachnospiraceae bacterium]
MTVKEIAKICNVSPATVSNILNGRHKASAETVERVMEVVRSTNYRPNPMAKSLRTKVTKTIGIIAEDIAQFTTPDILEGLMAVLEDAGYKTLCINLRLYARWGDVWYNSEESIQSVLRPAIEELKSVQIDGAVYIAGHVRNIKGFCEAIGVPNVITHAYSDRGVTASVMLDDVDGGYRITQYLIDHGHRNIGFVGGQSDNAHTIRRLEGYRKALKEAGIKYDSNLVMFGNWERISGAQCMDCLLTQRKKITAVFSVSDQMAGGVYDSLEAHGLRAGRDISVVGYDDMVIARYFRPGLTTMRMRLKEMGQKSGEMLLDMLSGSEQYQGKQVYLPCELVERESVGTLD